MSSRGKSAARSVDERYTQWKSLIPVLYDWLTNHKLLWPSISCRWGSQFEQAKYKNHQRLYLSEQTDGSVPIILVVANCEIVRSRVAAEEHISQFNEEVRSPFVKRSKTIIHPGEVNRIRELPQNSKIVATHTDSPNVLIWDVDAQPNHHAVFGAAESRPDLILIGHKENAEFALGMCPADPFVLSRGKDKLVVLWSIHDHISALGENAKSPVASSGASGGKQSAKAVSYKSSESPKVATRGVFQGHSHTVEDVQFAPSRSADNSVRMFDRRNITSGGVGSPVHKFEAHSAAVLCVQWCPDKASVFGSSAEDGFLNIWDHEQVGKTKEGTSTRAAISNPGLFFQHAGHRDKVVDFHWNASDPWTIGSVSDDCENSGGGGTLQIWRMSDMIYRPEEEILDELEKFKSHILSCRA